MKWIKGLYYFQKHGRPIGETSRFGPLCCNTQANSGARTKCLKERSCTENLFSLDSACKGNLVTSSFTPQNIIRRFWSDQGDPILSRDWFVKLWVADRKRKNSRRKRRPRVVRQFRSSGTGFGNQRSFKLPLEWWSSSASKTVPAQPPLSQSPTGFLEPASPEEVMVAPLLARSNLLITRDIEWANLVLGFEQENRYAIVDACYPESPVGFIREQSHIIYRQILRTRRPFIAYVTDTMGTELFRVRRPFWWINSTIYAEIDGKEVGVVHRRWHLWRRVYDLYLGKKQFAVVENPGFWNWTFTLKDIDGNVLAEVDRDWRGLGFELFTDAGQYVIRFGHADPSSMTEPASSIQELEVKRPLTLSERAVAVALAVSLDNDYFSRHGGWRGLGLTPQSSSKRLIPLHRKAQASRYLRLRHPPPNLPGFPHLVDEEDDWVDVETDPEDDDCLDDTTSDDELIYIGYLEAKLI
ncbi:Scramblase [Macleaya cordata]|uniref:Scramblase n=1 Tax=Macleaya cordata TaxID=56857 RepID=A0A200R6Y3_MACCD|nr:Scramblase [Macleaya cordata]